MDTTQSIKMNPSAISKLSNPAVERAVIGQIIADSSGDCFQTAQELGFSDEIFSEPQHRIVWWAIEACHRANGSADELSVNEKILRSQAKETPFFSKSDSRMLSSIVDPGLIVQMTLEVESFSAFQTHALILKNLWALRTISNVGREIEDKAEHGGEEFRDSPDELLGEVERTLISVTSKLAPKKTRDIASYFSAVDELTRPNMPVMGRYSGLPNLDSVLDGFKPNELIVLAARPSLGKTSLGCQIGMDSACPPKYAKSMPPATTVIFSLEMSGDQLAARLIANKGQLYLRRFRDNVASPAEHSIYAKTKAELRNAPIVIEDQPSMTVAQMRGFCRKQSQRGPLGMVIVDYLQLVAPANRRDMREQQVAQITRDLKIMSKELAVPILLLCQLNRASEKDNRDPKPSDLRESGAIEQDADVILFLVNRNPTDGQHTATQDIDVVVAKQRNGPAGVRVPLSFTGRFYKFEPVYQVQPTNPNAPKP